MMHETLISEVETIIMLMPSLARIWNMVEAMPGWLRMPTPTMETLAMSRSPVTASAPISPATFFRITMARS